MLEPTKINNSDIFKDPCRNRSDTHPIEKVLWRSVSLKISGTYIAKSALCAWKFDTIVFFSIIF